MNDALNEGGGYQRQYGRADVTYETWYSEWSRDLAKQHTWAELQRMLYGVSGEAARAALSHLRAIQRTTSMTSQSRARGQARNVVAAAGERAIALRGALEIYDLFPEHTKEADPPLPEQRSSAGTPGLSED